MGRPTADANWSEKGLLTATATEQATSVREPNLPKQRKPVQEQYYGERIIGRKERLCQ